jgi:hypothetical protein
MAVLVTYQSIELAAKKSEITQAASEIGLTEAKKAKFNSIIAHKRPFCVK